MAITGVIDVKGTSSTAYIVKIGMRALHGIIKGWSFEFSDGSNVNLSAHGGGNTNPYHAHSSSALKTNWISIPDGCDKLKFHDYNNNGHDGQIRQVYAYKNGTQVGYMNGGGHCGGTCAPGYIINCPYGHLISLIRVTIPATDYWQAFVFNIAHGTPDPNAKPINGGWSSWSEYTVCNKDCGPGLKKRTRTCTNPIPVLGGVNCIGDPDEFAACNIGVCLQNGGWGDYGDWGDCEGDCSVGAGIRKRTRKCDNPVPLGGGIPCSGNVSESEACYLTNCPVHGGWSEWGNWTACDNGKKMRLRECNNPTSSRGGDACSGDAVETASCPIEGGWDIWGNWSACKDSLQQRRRKCTNPIPSNGGDDCTGESTDIRMCSMPTHTTTEGPTHQDPGSGTNPSTGGTDDTNPVDGPYIYPRRPDIITDEPTKDHTMTVPLDDGKSWLEKNMVVILVILVIAIGFFLSRSALKTDTTDGTELDGTTDEGRYGGLESYATMGYGGVGPNST
jgi:hypothetical protein